MSYNGNSHTSTDEHEENIRAAVRLWALALEKHAKPEAAQGCDHIPVEYIGFVERYHYCVRCDAKQIDGTWRVKKT